jgi:hypothetical protein
MMGTRTWLVHQLWKPLLPAVLESQPGAAACPICHSLDEPVIPNMRR